MLQVLNGKKTYIVALGTLLGAIGSYLTGEAGLADTIQMAITALLATTLRHGITQKL